MGTTDKTASGCSAPPKVDFAHKAWYRVLVAEDKEGELNREDDIEFDLTGLGPGE